MYLKVVGTLRSVSGSLLREKLYREMKINNKLVSTIIRAFEILT